MTESLDPTDRIQQYIKHKKSMKFATIAGISFLRYCIAMIDEDLAIEIVKYGIDIDINEPWDNGQTPLHFACQMDMLDLIKTILGHKSKELNLYATTDDFLVQFNDFQCGGKTALHYCAMNGAIEVCKTLISFENKVLHSNELLFMTDFEGNTAVDSAIMNQKMHIAKYLLSLQTDKNINVEPWIKNREDELQNKRLIDSKSTRKRFQKQNADLLSKHDSLNKVFTIDGIWSEKRCDEILNRVIAYGDANGWTSKRHRSYATTDIPTFMIGYDLDEDIRGLLYDTLYPQMIENYDLNKRLNADVNKGEYVEIGVRDMFFVKYDVLKQNELKLHRDGSLLSFNILLNDSKDFEGGGTFIQHLNKVMTIDKGDCCMHSGKVLHAGHPITNGFRYILVGFLDAKVRKNRAKTDRMQSLSPYLFIPGIILLVLVFCFLCDIWRIGYGGSISCDVV